MRIHISEGNSKIGRVPNISLMPGESCGNVTCLNDCYALKAAKRWTNVHKAWSENLLYYRTNPAGFFKDLHEFLYRGSYSRFRIFVGGDFPDMAFLLHCITTAVLFKNISFLVFTKRYEFVESVAADLPSNLNVVLSMWPGMSIPGIAKIMPTAWVEPDTQRFNEFFGDEGQPRINCVSHCGKCGYKCWDKVSQMLPVMFKIH